MLTKVRNALIAVGAPGVRKNVLANKREGLETLLDYPRLALLSCAIKETARLEGDIAEFGSYRGGSAGLILRSIPTVKRLHVFDSFEGMPDVSTEDNFHKKGDFSDTVEDRVRAGLDSIGNNFVMHVGFFSKTIPEFPDPDEKFCLSHIDADLYDSILDALEFTYPRMVQGGVMIFDDYGAPSCEGAKKAVDEFFADKPETVVTLSQPSHGCIVGGGNAYETLAKHLSFPLNLPVVRSKVFDR